MTQIDIDDEDDNDNENEHLSFGQPVVVSRRGGKKDLSDTPIENALDIPLFEDSDKRGLRSVTYLKVIKLDKPGAGFKGNIPISSTLETIGQLHGDGVYNIEACNHRHQVLRSKENIRISLNETKTDSPKTNTTSSLELVAELNKNHAEEIKRTREISERVANESIVQARQHTDLIRATTESAAAREREFMQSAQKNQQDFFGNLMIAQSQMFQQTMAMITMGHQQTMESLRATTEREMNSGSNNVEVLMKGLSLGREMAGGDDSPDWLKALDKGGTMMKDLLQLKNDNQSQVPSLANNTATPQKQRDPNKKLPLTRNELLEIIRLKKSLNAKGIDFEAMVRQTREHLSDEAANSVVTSDDKEESTDEEDTEQTE
jgi:hypothetical protein